MSFSRTSAARPHEDSRDVVMTFRRALRMEISIEDRKKSNKTVEF